MSGEGDQRHTVFGGHQLNVEVGQAVIFTDLERSGRMQGGPVTLDLDVLSGIAQIRLAGEDVPDLLVGVLQ